MDETVLNACSGVGYSQHNTVDVAYIFITVGINYNNDNDDSESLRSYHLTIQNQTRAHTIRRYVKIYVVLSAYCEVSDVFCQ